MGNSAGNFQSLRQVPFLSLHDHQQVHIAVFRGFAIGIRAKEDDLPRMKVSCDLPGYFLITLLLIIALLFITSAPPCVRRL